MHARVVSLSSLKKDISCSYRTNVWREDEWWGIDGSDH